METDLLIFGGADVWFMVGKWAKRSEPVGQGRGDRRLQEREKPELVPSVGGRGALGDAKLKKVFHSPILPVPH